jgi:hypothetical protein
LLGSVLNNLRPTASYMHADRVLDVPCRAPPSKHAGLVARMTTGLGGAQTSATW